MNYNKKSIAIIGTGAIGGYYGIMLSQLGHDVHFLLRSDYESVKKNGLTLQSKVHGEIKLSKVNAYNDATQMPKADIVIVALKTTQNKAVLPEVLPFVADENTTIILIQNGLGMEEEVATWFPSFQIAGATALIGARKEKNGIIVHDFYGDIDFGSYNLKNTKVLGELVSDLKSINIPSSQQNLNLLRWKKLVWNMTFNGLSVVENQNTDELLTNHLDRANTLIQEVIGAANTIGVEIPVSFAENLIPFTEKMGSYAPSMRHDYLHNQALELEYLYENPIAEAQKHGFEMPEMKKLFSQLREIH